MTRATTEVAITVPPPAAAATLAVACLAPPLGKGFTESGHGAAFALCHPGHAAPTGLGAQDSPPCPTGRYGAPWHRRIYGGGGGCTPGPEPGATAVGAGCRPSLDPADDGAGLPALVSTTGVEGQSITRLTSVVSRIGRLRVNLWRHLMKRVGVVGIAGRRPRVASGPFRVWH